MATFQLSKEEFVSASFVMSKKRLIRVGVIMVLSVVGIGLARADSQTFLLSMAVAVPPGAALTVWLSRRRVGKLYDTQASLRETIEALIEDDGLHYTFDSGTYFLPWDRVLKWGENKRFIFLKESDYYGRILPKRALSPEEEATLRQHLEGVKKA